MLLTRTIQRQLIATEDTAPYSCHLQQNFGVYKYVLIILSAGNNVCDKPAIDISTKEMEIWGLAAMRQLILRIQTNRKQIPAKVSGSIQDIAMKLTKYTRRKSILLTLKEFHFSSLGKQKPLWWMKLSITSKENFLVTYKEIKRYCISINIVSNAFTCL